MQMDWVGTQVKRKHVASATRAIVLVRGAVTESTPKTKTGDRLIWLDAETVRVLKEHRTAQLKAWLMSGSPGRTTT